MTQHELDLEKRIQEQLMLKRWPKYGFPCAYYGKYFLAINFSVNAYLLFQW